MIGSGEAHRQFAQCQVLRRPGVYGLIAKNEIYIGMGGDVAHRIVYGSQIAGSIDTIFGIVGGNCAISLNDARAMERMLWSRVWAHSRLSPVINRPDGAPIDAHRYGSLDRLLANACLTLQQEGVLFTGCTARDLVAGPIAEPYRVAPGRALADVPEGEALELSFGKGLSAIVVRQDDGNFLLLKGSDVRAETVCTATSTVSFLRAAWLHSGLLERSATSRHYVVARDLVFTSLSAATQFVVGSKGRRLD